jgi:hypothetical protein
MMKRVSALLSGALFYSFSARRSKPTARIKKRARQNRNSMSNGNKSGGGRLRKRKLSASILSKPSRIES